MSVRKPVTFPPLTISLVRRRKGTCPVRTISCAARSRSGYAFDAAIACPRWLCSNTRNINACVMSNSGTIAVGMK